MAESVQKKLQRVRPPRVQVTYDLEIGGAIQLKELPFVLGVLGDFTGMPAEEMEEFKSRRFVNVTPDNFDGVLAKMKPHVGFSVPNKITNKPGERLKVDLSFTKLSDFDPDQVAEKIEPLRELLELRTQLKNLKGTLQTNEKLDKVLSKAIAETESMNKLKAEISGTGEKGTS